VVLCVTDDPTSVNLSEKYGEVVFVPEVEDVPSYQSTTWGRFWITGKYPDRVCMVGEINMIPISVPFFTDNIREFDATDYVHLCADHLSRAIGLKRFDYRYVGEHPVEGSVGGQGSYANHLEAHLRHASASLGESGGKMKQYLQKTYVSTVKGEVRLKLELLYGEKRCLTGKMGFRFQIFRRTLIGTRPDHT
jgi:hypothetical protein